MRPYVITRSSRPVLFIEKLLALAVLCGSTSQLTHPQVLGSASITHEATSDVIVADQPRPLEAAVAALTEEYGWAVDYEDPAYQKTSSDVTDMTDPTWLQSHPDRHFLGLKGGRFTTRLVQSEATASAPYMPTLARVVDEYNHAPLPGQFALRTGANEHNAVVGIASRNAAGVYEQQPVVLDTMIAMPSSTELLSDALQTFVSTLQTTTSHHVVVGTIPINLLNHVPCVIPTEQLPARQLLWKLLANSPVKLSYAFLYDLNSDLFVLNVSVVTRATKDETGQAHRRAVPSPR